MKTVTAITQQKDPKRCNIFLDGEFFCGLPLETVMKCRIKVGMTIDSEELEKIQLDSELLAATDKAMSYLTGSVKTEKQVRDYLRGKGYTPLVVGHVVEKLKGYSLIDDAEYARRYVETYSGKKGARLMLMELKTKGVSAETAERAVAAVDDQTEAAYRIAVKYTKGKTPDREGLQKLYRYLLSKGFSYDEARAAADRLGNSDDGF